MNTLKGMCLCEKVRYEIKGHLGPAFHCHCSKCRRWHGAAFRTRASIDASQFNVITGHSYIAKYQSSEDVTKHFCKKCGSPLHSTYLNKPDVVGIPLGALEGVIEHPEAHIFVGSKATWHTISDSLPQFSEWPGSQEKVRETNN